MIFSRNGARGVQFLHSTPQHWPCSTARGTRQYVIHRTGHGVGLAGHEFPDDMAFNQRALLKNEVYSAEPGIYIYGVGGFRHDDTVIVADPPERITHHPKDLKSQTI